MRLEQATKEHRDIANIKALYERAFPENERHPFEVICDEKKEHVEILAFYEEELFCGFVVLLNCNGIAHIVYFSIEEELRNHGYGSKVLQCVHEAKKESRVIVDIERVTNHCSNAEQRMKRKQFYLRNGYEETEVKYRWRGDDYEILSYGGTITKKEFGDFWDTLKFII
ncbi:MAG: GNAT family N-acetyltransferase [Erysipelotrichaceae bacterium]|nr:GNAT family N-acetyltransferase [Erysipelotrichaceae bacterium]